MENTIKIKNKKTLKFKIETEDGKDTGEFLEFDFSDKVGKALEYQDMLEKKKKNVNWLRNQVLIIEKRQDVKGKKALSKNQEDLLKALKSFFEKQEEIYNLFLGENGFRKLSNGVGANWETIEDVDKIIDEQLSPYLDVEIDNFEEQIKNKYKGLVDKKGVI